jgi:Mrp family chromosome partitioning ATPase/uncharacterized protein involved in exopolysaccharide biosynthesis
MSDTQNESVFRDITSEELTDRYDVRKLFAGLQRHLPLILISAVLGTALGAYLSYYLQHTYKAEAIVMFQEDRTPVQARETALTRFNLATAVDMIKVPNNLQAVKSILGLDMSIKEIDGMIDVPPPKSESNLIYVVARGNNPNLVLDLANTLAKAAVKNSQDYNQHQLQLALDNYKAELENMRRKLASQSQEIEEFKRTHQYFEMTAEYAGLLNQLKEARSSLQLATLKYNSLLIEYENLKRENESLPDRIPISSESGGTVVDQRLSSLQAALAEARAKYAPDNPKVKILENQIRDMLGQTQSTTSEQSPVDQLLTPNVIKEKIAVELMRMQGRVRAAEKIKQDLEGTVSALDKQLNDLPSKQMTIQKLLTAKQITEEQVRLLNASVENTQLMINLPKGTIEMFQEADKAKPLREGLFVNLLPLIMLVLGTIGGVLAALFREMQDDHIWTAKQVSLAYTVPCLMTVPKLNLQSKEGAVGASLFYIRILAERLEKASKKNTGIAPRYSVSITSSIDEEGKSWISYYLAKYYANQGKRVIYLQLDPENTDAHENLGSAKSIVAYLSGKATIQEIIRPGKPDIIQLKHHEPMMKELVKSPLMTDLWNKLKTDYDVIVIDSPSIIHHHYATNLAALADMTVLVIDSPKVTKNLVDESLEELSRVGDRPFGIILNEVPECFLVDERTRLEHSKHHDSFLSRWFGWKDS